MRGFARDAGRQPFGHLAPLDAGRRTEVELVGSEFGRERGRGRNQLLAREGVRHHADVVVLLAQIAQSRGQRRGVLLRGPFSWAGGEGGVGGGGGGGGLFSGGKGRLTFWDVGWWA